LRVAAEEGTFRFFFVEKNRIDNFSRIAATPPGRKTDLIEVPVEFRLPEGRAYAAMGC
jgi:hypothetical protein